MTATTRLADQIAALRTVPLRAEQATVLTVVAGGAADGNALVTVRWAGANIRCAYPSSYAPVAGHVVLVLTTAQPVILCRLIGTPPPA